MYRVMTPEPVDATSRWIPFSHYQSNIRYYHKMGECPDGECHGHIRPCDDAKDGFYLTERGIGVTVFSGEHNYYDDSDFYVIVWDREKNKPREIEIASTRGWSYPCYGAEVDATPEIMAKYEAWQEMRHQEAIEIARQKEATTVRFGRTVKVVKGRKVPIGTIGRVAWIGMDRWGERAGIDTIDGTRYFTAITNLEVVNA